MIKKVTIGLPVVKFDYFPVALKSAINQTYDNVEIIVQNNASCEFVKNQIREFVKTFHDHRIVYFENKIQLPMIKNWNSILSKANGDFFTLLCDDDIIHVDFIAEAIILFEKYPLSKIFHTRVAIIDQNEELMKITSLCPEFEDGLDFIYHRVAGLRQMYLSDFILETNAIKSISGFVDMPDGWGSDDITWFKLSVIGGVCYSPKTLMTYRSTDLNISNNKNYNNKLKAVKKQKDEIALIVNSTKQHYIKTKMVLEILDNYIKRMKINLLKMKYQKKYYMPKNLAIILSIIIGSKK